MFSLAADRFSPVGLNRVGLAGNCLRNFFQRRLGRGHCPGAGRNQLQFGELRIESIRYRLGILIRLIFELLARLAVPQLCPRGFDRVLELSSCVVNSTVPGMLVDDDIQEGCRPFDRDIHLFPLAVGLSVLLPC